MTSRQMGIETYLYFSSFGRFSSNNHYPSTALSSIDCRDRSIFQYINRSNVCRRNIIDVIHLKTIDNVKRIIALGHRRTSTNTNVNICPWSTIDRSYLHTSYFSLQSHSG